MQYTTGTVTLKSGEQCVSGEGTAWLSNVSVGDLFKRRTENAIYVIGQVTTDTTLSLTANWVGTVDVSGEQYQITRDFTPNYDVPEIWPGDKDWAFHLTYGLRIFDNELKAVEDAISGTYEIVDHGLSTSIVLDSSDYNKIHLFYHSGESGTVSLPEPSSNDIGKWLDLRKRSSHWLELNRSGAGTIFEESRCLNETDDVTASLLLTLETATNFGATNVQGVWNFTSSGET